MNMTTILLVVIPAVVAACIAWFLLKNRKSSATQKPSEADIHETYDPKPSGGEEEKESEKEPEKPKEEEKPKPSEKEKPDNSAPQPNEDPVVTLTDQMVTAFAPIVSIEKKSKTWYYLQDLLREADGQYRHHTSPHGLPLICTEENFPVLHSPYGTDFNDALAFSGMCGWLTALLLTELRPDLREELMKRGYEMGAGRSIYIYRYDFRSDQNLVRLQASAIYAAMRGWLRPDTDQLRRELGGSLLDVKLSEMVELEWEDFEDTFFLHIERFMPTAPGPYLSTYRDRSAVGGQPYPAAEKCDDGNLPPDSYIASLVVERYNLSDPEMRQRTIQAIADKESDVAHLFGDSRTAGEFQFSPVFGVYNIGLRLNPEGRMATLARLVGEVASMAREPLLTGSYYGRRRPGQTERDGVAYDDPKGILVNFDIENLDGHPVGYYDRHGDYRTDLTADPGDYDYQMRHKVYANSYPSGHSAYIWSIALVLIELMPSRTDLILRAACQYALSRQIARFHYNSDTMIGRLIGSSIAGIVRATQDFRALMDAARDELKRS